MFVNHAMQWLIQDYPGGVSLLFGIIFAANCMKMKKKLDWDTPSRSATVMAICLMVSL